MLLELATINLLIHVLMRHEKEGKKKQARSNFIATYSSEAVLLVK